MLLLMFYLKRIIMESLAAYGNIGKGEFIKKGKKIPGSAATPELSQYYLLLT